MSVNHPSLVSSPSKGSFSYRWAELPLSTDPAAHSRVDQVYHQILAHIVRGELPAGTELKSTRLANQLQVSRTPVVQALARLMADGIVTQRMNMRAVVRPGAANWLLEIHELRLLLEPPAAARASQHITEKVLNQLDLQSACAAPDAGSDWEKLAREFDYSLHLAIADHVGNQPLRDAIYKCWQFKKLSYELGPERQESASRGYHEHLSILAALKARDAAAASAAMELHLRHASSYRPERQIV